MLHDREGFVRLPNERLIYSSPPRTSLALTPPPSYKGAESLSVQSSAGCIYLTNQRVGSPLLRISSKSLTANDQVIYLPSQNSDSFQSFSSPLLNVRDSHVSAPFFGPNVWTALVRPVSGGGISPNLPAVQIKVTFKEGGAFDFHTNFERIRERLEQAVENMGEGAQGLRAVDLSAVHLEELPAYDGLGNTNTNTIPSDAPPPQHNRRSTMAPEPVEPPPCYEEVQSQSVADELEERLRRAS